MKPVAGLEISLYLVRAVTVSRFSRSPLRRFDLPWSAESIEDTVALLRENLGVVSSIGIALGFEFLHLKHLKLPPVDAAAKRQIVTLEPERFFPVSTPVVVTATEKSDLVFAAEASIVEKWVAALDSWAPVQVVEPSPVAFVRGARRAGIRDGLFEIEAGKSERGYAELKAGALLSARRLSARNANPGAVPAPEWHGVPGAFLPAFGAALGSGIDTNDMLLSEGLRTAIGRRRARSLVLSGAVAAASMMFAFFSATQSRARFLSRIEAEIASLRPQAAAAEGFENRIARIGLASAAANAAQARVDPLSVIASLSRLLPRDVIVMSVAGSGDEWQIAGTATDAGAILPALDADPEIENVRFLAGTSRFTEGRRTYETFSIGFRAIPRS